MIVPNSRPRAEIVEMREAPPPRGSDYRFQTMANAAPVMVWVADVQGVRTFFNHMWLRFTGRRTTEELAEKWMTSLHPRDRRHCLNTYVAAARDQKRFRIEFRMKRHDGQYRWILETGAPRFTHGNIFVGHIGSAIDITEQKRANDLEVEQRRFLEMVAKGRPIHQVFDYLTQFVQRESSGAACAIMLLDEDTTKLEMVSTAGLPKAFANTFETVALGFGNGSCTTAALRRRAVVVSDIGSDSVWLNYKMAALASGLRASTSVPVLGPSGRIFGTCAIYYRTERHPGNGDMRLIKMTSHLLSIALERQRTEEELMKATQKYRDIFENAVEGIFQSTPHGRFIAANPAMAEMLGFATPGELIESRVDITTQHYVLPQRRAEFQRLIETNGTVERFEAEVYRKDGTKIWTSSNVRFVKDENRDARYYEGTVEDITERKNAERALRASEEKFRHYFELGLIGMAITSPRKEMIEVNDHFCKLLGYDRNEISQITWAELTHPDDLAVDVDQFERVLRGEIEGYELNKRFLRKGGEIIHANISVRGVRKPDRTVGYFIALLQDVSDRKRAEEAQKNLLRRVVSAQEAEQRRLSLELHDHMGQSLAALMLGLKSTSDSCQCHAASDQLHKLQQLTNDLANEVHTLATQLRPPALDDLGLQTALTNYVQEWSERSGILAHLHCNGLIDAHPPAIIETTVYRIVQEALTNVLKHAQAQNVSIIIECRNARMRAIIEDDGSGFNADCMSESPVRNGRLGLLGMQERSALVGGKLNIESTEGGGGTTVILEIPI